MFSVLFYIISSIFFETSYDEIIIDDIFSFAHFLIILLQLELRNDRSSR